MRYTRNTMMLAVVSCVGAVAIEGGLSAIGWNEADAWRIAETYFANQLRGALPCTGLLTAGIKRQWAGRGPAERAQAVHEVAVESGPHCQDHFSAAISYRSAGPIQNDWN